MKNIKIVSLLILCLFVLQTASAQTDQLNQGREHGATAGTPQIETQAVFHNQALNEGDRDIPLAIDAQEEESEWMFPIDLDILQAEMNASATPQEIVSRLNAMEEELAQLRLYNEQLRLENRTIKRSLGSCCSEIGSNLTAADAYLLQNAPNPAKDASEIRFFVPSDIRSAQIKISDFTGTIIQTIPLTEGGFGKIDINRVDFPNGTYIYSLEVNDELIDTKVMILTD